jgi:integrase
MRNLWLPQGRGTSNRVIALLNSVYNFATKQGYFTMANPCYGIKKFRIHSRDRFLSKEELQKFFAAIKLEKQIFQDYFSLLLYTGARKSNVLAMKWADIDFDLCRWRINHDEAKNNDVNIVALSNPSLEILHRRKAKSELFFSVSPYVFPGIGAEGYLKDPKKAFARIKKRMDIDDIRMHDLRRTLASYMAISGVSLPIIGAALNHKSHTSTEIYARLTQAPVLDAVNAAAEVILLTSQDSN